MKIRAEVRKRLLQIGNVRAFLILVWEAGRLLAIIYLVLRVLRAVVPVAILYITKLVIDSAVHSVQTGIIDWARLRNLIVTEAAFALISDILGRCVSVTDWLINERVANGVSVKLIRHASKLDLAQFEEADYQDKLDCAQQIIQRLKLTTQLMSAVQECLMLALYASAIIALLPWLLIILVCAGLPAFYAECRFASLSYLLVKRHAAQRRELDYVRDLGLSQESAKEVKIFGIGDYLVERYRRLSGIFENENRALMCRRATVGAMLTCIGTLGYYGAYAVILYETMHGKLSIGSLTFLAASFARCRSLLEGLLTNLSGITEQSMYLESLFAFLRIEPRIRSKGMVLAIPRPVRKGIEFRRVGFRYPGTDRNALHDVSFIIRPGETLAVIGENGAGKTTIIKLLTRLYDPTAGRILLDGVDLREYDISEWRRQIGVIFQDYMRYQMLFSENIGLGCLEHSHDQVRIIGAARSSLASEVAARLEHGYRQMIGRRFAGGIDLSTGEWQKVALARAYLRHSQMLIFDEPTAALDARSEQKIIQSMREHAAGKMIILISHRLSTARLADRIIVLRDGRISEYGKHEELSAMNGLYAELFELQAAGYK